MKKAQLLNINPNPQLDTEEMLTLELKMINGEYDGLVVRLLV